jgi:hypothetical protein
MPKCFLSDLECTNLMCRAVGCLGRPTTHPPVDVSRFQAFTVHEFSALNSASVGCTRANIWGARLLPSVTISYGHQVVKEGCVFTQLGPRDGRIGNQQTNLPLVQLIITTILLENLCTLSNTCATPDLLGNCERRAGSHTIPH